MFASSAAEVTPLLPSPLSDNSKIRRKQLLTEVREFNVRYVCFRYRGPALLLVWNFAILFVLILLETVLYDEVKVQVGVTVTSALLYRFNYICYVLYPLAGLAADLLCGRYKVVLLSVSINIGLLFVVVLLELLTLSRDLTKMIRPILFFGVAVLAVHGFFQANALQFGADHLHDASSEELRSFIYWFVWVQAIAQVPIVIAENPYIKAEAINLQYATLTAATLVLVAGALLLVCHFTCHKMSAWYIHEPPSRNPYLTVCHVLYFAKKHKVPVNRSSLTYWEDDLPARIDLGKSKYGGPFSDEQVEDVKTLIGVSLVLLSLGSFGYLQVVASPHIMFIKHVGMTDGFKLVSALLASPIILSVFVIPIHELLYRLHACRPSMLGKLRFAMLLYVVCIGINLIVDSVGHFLSNNVQQCMFADEVSYIGVHSSIVLIPALLSSLATVIINVTSMEFIIAQSPYSMRGMLIGLFFLSQGIFGFVGSLSIVSFNESFTVGPKLSCCSLYYIVHFNLALIILIVFCLIAQKYQLRTRAEVINEYQIVEEHYNRINQTRGKENIWQ